MEWKPLTEDDALSGITMRERDDFAKTSVGQSVTDRLEPIITDLVSEIRGYISTWSPNTLSANSSLIPPSFKGKAVALLRRRLLITKPNSTPGDARKSEYDKAEQFFRDVARGIIRPEPADDAIPTQTPPEKPSSVEIVSSPGSRTGRSRMNGI